MDLRIVGELTAYDPRPINVRCPACHHVGAFPGIKASDIVWTKLVRTASGVKATESCRVGMRQCPNESCRSVIFYAERDGSRVTFPPEVIDFDAANLPPDILSSLEEAIKCHAAGCYRASALMVRRTLEELCDDKAAKGKDLKLRIAALSSVALLPTDLLTAADELRILGNDAAHIEAKDYDAIGKEESELAIELTKELLKAVYQYTSLVQRLTALKKPRTP
ncbi:MAG: DUF4145 domain-containing protein [Pseudomonadota bacterium]